MMRLITAVTLRTFPSSPIRSMIAAAFWSFAGEITEASPPPMPPAAATLADPERNMVHVVARAAAGAFGSAYGFAAPYLGLLAGFISGSETSAVAMMSRFHVETASAALGKPMTTGLMLRSRPRACRRK